jgi:hypothetical protein
VRFVDRTGPGRLELNYMWMPTWVGMNEALIREIEELLSATIMGQPITDETLDLAHQAVLEILVNKFPALTGLFEYLDGIKYVDINGNTQTTEERGTASLEG